MTEAQSAAIDDCKTIQALEEHMAARRASDEYPTPREQAYSLGKWADLTRARG